MHAGLIAGGQRADFVYGFHAAAHFAKHRIAKAIGLRGIETGIVHHIDKKLRSSRVRIAAAGHGDSAPVVAQAVGCFKGNGAPRRFLRHGRSEAAALHHKAVNHAVKYRAFVMLVIDILQEIFHRFRGFFCIEFDDEITHAGLKLDRGGRLRVRRQTPYARYDKTDECAARLLC